MREVKKIKEGGGERKGRDSVERGSEIGLATGRSDVCENLEKACAMN